MKKLLLAVVLLLSATSGWAQQSACPPLCFYPPKWLSLTGGTLTGPLSLSTGNSVFLYNTADQATNYERGGLRWTADQLELFTEKGGTGNTRAIYLNPGNNFVYTKRLYPVAHDSWELGSATAAYKGAAFSQYIMGAKPKALTDTPVATAFVTVAVPTNGWVGGKLIWTATSVSGADQLTTTGEIRFAGAATAATPVCTVGVIGTDLAAVSGGANTLVCTWTNVVAAQTCALSVTCTNNLAGTQAITLNGRLDMPTTATLVFP